MGNAMQTQIGMEMGRGVAQMIELMLDNDNYVLKCGLKLR